MLQGNTFGTAQTFSVTTDGSATNTVRFSPDGRQLAAGGSDGRFNFWNYPLPTPRAPNGADVLFMASNGAFQDVNMIAFHPSGGYVGVANGGWNAGGFGTIWDVATRGPRGRFTPAYWPMSVAFTGDGKLLRTVSSAAARSRSATDPIA